MGQFKIEITGVGNHGQDREKGDGEKVDFHQGGIATPDSVAKRLIEELALSGSDLEKAEIVHWPDEEGEVRDDLLTGVRKGNF